MSSSLDEHISDGESDYNPSTDLADVSSSGGDSADTLSAAEEDEQQISSGNGSSSAEEGVRGNQGARAGAQAQVPAGGEPAVADGAPAQLVPHKRRRDRRPKAQQQQVQAPGPQIQQQGSHQPVVYSPADLLTFGLTHKAISSSSIAAYTKKRRIMRKLLGLPQTRSIADLGTLRELHQMAAAAGIQVPWPCPSPQEEEDLMRRALASAAAVYSSQKAWKARRRQQAHGDTEPQQPGRRRRHKVRRTAEQVQAAGEQVQQQDGQQQQDGDHHHQQQQHDQDGHPQQGDGQVQENGHQQQENGQAPEAAQEQAEPGTGSGRRGRGGSGRGAGRGRGRGGGRGRGAQKHLKKPITGKKRLPTIADAEGLRHELDSLSEGEVQLAVRIAKRRRVGAARAQALGAGVPHAPPAVALAADQVAAAGHGGIGAPGQGGQQQVGGVSDVKAAAATAVAAGAAQGQGTVPWFTLRPHTGIPSHRLSYHLALTTSLPGNVRPYQPGSYDPAEWVAALQAAAAQGAAAARLGKGSRARGAARAAGQQAAGQQQEGGQDEGGMQDQAAQEVEGEQQGQQGQQPPAVEEQQQQQEQPGDDQQQQQELPLDGDQQQQQEGIQRQQAQAERKAKQPRPDGIDAAPQVVVLGAAQQLVLSVRLRFPVGILVPHLVESLPLRLASLGSKRGEAVRRRQAKAAAEASQAGAGQGEAAGQGQEMEQDGGAEAEGGTGAGVEGTSGGNLADGGDDDDSDEAPRPPGAMPRVHKPRRQRKGKKGAARALASSSWDTVLWSAHLPNYLLHPQAAAQLQGLEDGRSRPEGQPGRRGRPPAVSNGIEGTYTIGTRFRTPDDAAAAVDLLLLALQRPTSPAERLAPRVPLNHGLQAYNESERRPRAGEELRQLAATLRSCLMFFCTRPPSLSASHPSGLAEQQPQQHPSLAAAGAATATDAELPPAVPRRAVLPTALKLHPSELPGLPKLGCGRCLVCRDPALLEIPCLNIGLFTGSVRHQSDPSIRAVVKEVTYGNTWDTAAGILALRREAEHMQHIKGQVLISGQEDVLRPVTRLVPPEDRLFPEIYNDGERPAPTPGDPGGSDWWDAAFKLPVAGWVRPPPEDGIKEDTVWQRANAAPGGSLVRPPPAGFAYAALATEAALQGGQHTISFQEPVPDQCSWCMAADHSLQQCPLWLYQQLPPSTDQGGGEPTQHDAPTAIQPAFRGAFEYKIEVHGAQGRDQARVLMVRSKPSSRQHFKPLPPHKYTRTEYLALMEEDRLAALQQQSAAAAAAVSADAPGNSGWSDVAEPALLEQAHRLQQAVAWGNPPAAAQPGPEGGVTMASSVLRLQEQQVNDTSIFLALLAQEMVAELSTAATEAMQVQERNSIQ